MKKYGIRRIIALLCAIAIPLSYVISIALFAAGSTYAQLFLAIAMGITFFLLPVVYLVTKVPKDVADMYTNLSDRMKKEEEKK